MIFISLGSREYQFDRLLREIDNLIEDGSIKESVFAQIGNSNYIPKYYKFERYLSPDEFINYQKKADLIISHGGTGALIGALKLGKKVIAVPRKLKYNEHTDDHQNEVSIILEQNGFLESVDNIKDLMKKIKLSKEKEYKPFYLESNVINIVVDFLEDLSK